MARLPNFLVIIRSEKLSGKGQGRGAKKRTFRFGKKNVSFPKVETFRFADYSGNRSLMGCCVLAFSPLSKEEIFPFIKITHNSRYSFKYTWFFIEFIRCLLEYEDKGQALQQAEQRCGVEVNRQNLCNGSFVVDTVESVVNWFMAGNSYKECVFSAINSGKSSDAVGALTGLLAGIYYGLELKNGVKGFETMESYIDSFIQYLNPTL